MRLIGANKEVVVVVIVGIVTVVVTKCFVNATVTDYSIYSLEGSPVWQLFRIAE